MENMGTGDRCLGVCVCDAVVFAAVLTFTVATTAAGQEAFTHGQNIAPVFEGWEVNEDGSFNMVFGFFNRNCEEVLHIPIGPNNNIEPGGPDQGQPTTFFARRGKFIFKLQVPSDFGNKEIVWSLSVRGKTEKAYATLNPQYVLDRRITMMNEGGFGQVAGEADSAYPDLLVRGNSHRTVKVGEPLSLTAVASDDGLPLPKKGQEGSGKAGLMVGWLVYRGDGRHVSFEPEQFNPDFRARYARTMCRNTVRVPDWAKKPLPSDGEVSAAATFSEPGRYVLRAMAHDGGLKTTREVTVTVSE
jgi:hypothetical protein